MVYRVADITITETGKWKAIFNDTCSGGEALLGRPFNENKINTNFIPHRSLPGKCKIIAKYSRYCLINSHNHIDRTRENGSFS